MNINYLLSIPGLFSRSLHWRYMELLNCVENTIVTPRLDITQIWTRNNMWRRFWRWGCSWEGAGKRLKGRSGWEGSRNGLVVGLKIHYDVLQTESHPSGFQIHPHCQPSITFAVVLNPKLKQKHKMCQHRQT